MKCPRLKCLMQPSYCSLTRDFAALVLNIVIGSYVQRLGENIFAGKPYSARSTYQTEHILGIVFYGFRQYCFLLVGVVGLQLHCMYGSLIWLFNRSI